MFTDVAILRFEQVGHHLQYPFHQGAGPQADVRQGPHDLWVADRLDEDPRHSVVEAVGVLEILGALGVILPWATGILPWLTPLAAIGLGLTMVGAFLTHLRRKELVPMGIVNIVLFSVAVFTAYGRFF